MERQRVKSTRWWMSEQMTPCTRACESTPTSRSSIVRRRQYAQGVATPGVVAACVVAAIFAMMGHGNVALAQNQDPAQQNTDPWEVWSTRPSGEGTPQDALLIEGRLRHTVTQHDIEAFKSVLTSQGCVSEMEAAQKTKCTKMINQGADKDGRTIYHMVGKLGLGGDFLEGMPHLNITTGPSSVQTLIRAGLLNAASWRSDANDEVTTKSFLYKMFHHLKDVLGITPNFNLRDASGQTAMHEAALNGHVLTIRTMVFLTNKAVFAPTTDSYRDPYPNGPVIRLDDTVVRARALRREWAFGWTMMNFAALSARDSALRQSVQSAMATAMEGGVGSENFDVSKGMTVMDYAAINGHTAVVDYLAFTEQNSAGVAGLSGLGMARSNWREIPVQKAVTLGHIATVEKFIEHYGCAAVFAARSEAGETIFHNAVGGGHDHILRMMKEKCPAQFGSVKTVRTRLNTKKYLWGEDSPCLMSQSIIRFINLNEFGKDRIEFDEPFLGHHRYKCSHDLTVGCMIDADCQALMRDGQTSTCDISQGAKYDVYDLLHHFNTCRLVCEGATQDPMDKACGPTVSEALHAWLAGSTDPTNPIQPRDPQRGPPAVWEEYRKDPTNWYNNLLLAQQEAEAGA